MAASKFQIVCAVLFVALLCHEANSQLGGLLGGGGGAGSGGSPVGGLLGGGGQGLLGQLVTALLGNNTANPSVSLLSQLLDQLLGVGSGSPCCYCCNGTNFGVNNVCARVGHCPRGGIVACTAQACKTEQNCRLLELGNLLCVDA